MRIVLWTFIEEVLDGLEIVQDDDRFAKGSQICNAAYTFLSFYVYREGGMLDWEKKQTYHDLSSISRAYPIQPYEACPIGYPEANVLEGKAGTPHVSSRSDVRRGLKLLRQKQYTKVGQASSFRGCRDEWRSGQVFRPLLLISTKGFILRVRPESILHPRNNHFDPDAEGPHHHWIWILSTRAASSCQKVAWSSYIWE